MKQIKKLLEKHIDPQADARSIKEIIEIKRRKKYAAKSAFNPKL